MKDEDIVINVYQSFLNPKRYTICASYKNDPFKSSGEGYAEDSFTGRLFSGDLDSQIKRATCNAIKDLKSDYNNNKQHYDYMMSLQDKAQSFVEKCRSDKND